MQIPTKYVLKKCLSNALCTIQQSPISFPKNYISTLILYFSMASTRKLLQQIMLSFILGAWKSLHTAFKRYLVVDVPLGT